ncbi:MAG: ATP-binding protein [Anaeromyxobacter sp.]
MLIRTKIVLGTLLIAAVVAALSGVLLWSALRSGEAHAEQEIALSRSRAALELAAASSALIADLESEPAAEEPAAYPRMWNALRRVQAVLDEPNQDVASLLALVQELRTHPLGAGRGTAFTAWVDQIQVRVGRLTAAVYLDVYEHEVLAAAEESRHVSTLRGVAFGAAGGSALLLALGATLFLSRMRRGLAALHEGAARIERGELDVPIAISERDEVGELARAMDAMAARLRSTVVTRERLEAVVADRTAALETSRAELAQRLVELETTRSRLGASDRLAAVGRLSRGLTHEINNPLAIVQANLDYLRDELASGAGAPREGEVRDAVIEAAAATRRMTQIVKDLAAFSREPGDDQGPSDLALVLEAVRRLVAPELHARARLEVDLPPGPLPVRGSASALGHVFGRLVLDAFASYPEPPPADGSLVRVVVRRDGGGVELEVRDRGTPIPPEVLPHAFDPFFTPTAGFTAGRGGRGVGVGLAACYGIVESVGGSISVESAKGTGTVFRVRLRGAASDTGVALHAGEPVRRRARVLVLHEDPLALAALYRLLADRFEVVPHTSPRHALTLLAAGERFDAAVVHADLREVGAEAILEALVTRSPELARATVVLGEDSPEGASLVEAVFAAASGDGAPHPVTTH